MADINERVVVETDQSVANLDDLTKASQTADEWIDNVIDKARAADKEEISVPVDVPGAKQAADDLDHVDESARKAGGGAKVGVADISDMTGPLGDASGAAGTFGQAFEGLGSIVETAGGKMGLSEEAMGKLSTALGAGAVGIGVVAAAWTLYKSRQDEAREATEKMVQVQKDMADSNFAKAAEDLVKNNESIFDRATKAGIGTDLLTAALTGSEGAMKKIKDQLDQNNPVLRDLTIDIGHAQDAYDKAAEKTQLMTERTGAVTAALHDVSFQARLAKGDIDSLAQSYADAADVFDHTPKTPDVPQLPPGAIGPSSSTLTGAVIYNIFPPANTPIAVDQAIQRNDQIQGPR